MAAPRVRASRLHRSYQRLDRAVLPVRNSLVDQRANVGDLPRFSNLAAVKVADNRLVQAEGSTAPGDAGEVVAECPGDDDTCHFHGPRCDNLLHLVAKVRHGCHCLAPHLLLRFKVLSRQAPRRMDYDIMMQEVIEGFNVTRVTGG